MLNYFSTIRARLLVLVFLGLFPVLGLLLSNYQEQKQQAIIEGKESALRTARLAAKDQDYLFEGARQLLVAMAQLPSVRNHDAKECSQFLADLLNQFPIYENLGAADAKGNVFCSAIHTHHKVSLEDREWFLRAIQTRSFVAGDYITARISGRAALTNAYPIFDESDQISTVVFAGIDLDWLDKFVAEAQMPEGSTLTVVDQSGVILTRYPDADAWRGKTLYSSTIDLLLSQGQGVSDHTGIDGIPRLYGFTRLCCMPWNSIYLLVGIPREKVLEEANRDLARNLSIFGLVLLLSLTIARVGANLIILHPFTTLLNAIKRFDSGDFSLRVGKTFGGRELDQLAHALNQMAATVEARGAERNRTEEILRVQNALARTLASTAARLNTQIDLQTMLDMVCQETAKALMVSSVSISLYDEKLDMFYCVSQCGLPNDFCNAKSLGLDSCFPQLKLGKAIYLADIASEPCPQNASLLRNLKVSGFTSNPLLHEGKLAGALCVFIREDEHSLTEMELTFLRAMSDQTAQAIGNARLYQALKEEQLSKAALLEKTISAQEDERKRIARELHDQTSQDLSALMLSLDACAMGLTVNSAGTGHHLQTAKDLVGTILGNIHQLINDLRPALLDDLGLASAILWYGEQRLKPLGIILDFHCNRIEARLPPHVETALFRILQETLTNIVKHANASRVKVNLDVDEEKVTLAVEDNGIGFDLSSVLPEQPDGRGLGLRGMLERVTTLQGELEILSKLGEGTTIRLKVPLL